MKRLISALCILSIGLSAGAFELYPYQSQEVQNISGKAKSKGITDYIIMPSNEKFNIIDELLSPSTASATLPRVIRTSDPYIVPVNGVNYVMVKDKKGTNWNEQDLLGIDDPKNNMFLSLRNLESDGDYSKITAAELKKAGIRLVRLDSDGSLLVNERNKDLNLNKIDYIDMNNLIKTANSKETGIFGHFNVYLKTKDSSKRMTVGYVTFDTHSNLQIYFK